MPKLNITAEQIQSTTNMLTSGDASTWNDDGKYPSAKAVYNLVDQKVVDRDYPIGSILITSSNDINPNDVINTGTWVLVDKEYQVAATEPITWTPYNSKATLSRGIATCSNHMIYLTMELTANSAISPSPDGQITGKLGQINPNSIGAIYDVSHPNPLAFNTTTDFTLAYAVTGTEATAESCIIVANLSTTGEVNIRAILNATKQLVSGTKIYLSISVPMKYTNMADSFCDKFYWKRVT